MDLFRLDDKDLTEVCFDMDTLKEVFYEGISNFQTDFGFDELDLGNYHLTTYQQGNIYFAKTKYFFHKNILAKSSSNINNVTLYFVRKGGGVYDFTLNSKPILQNNHNVLFSHEDYKSSGVYSKEKLTETTSLHLPISHFENLVAIYPEIFETYFLRYQKGESFYLNNNYMPNSSQINQILLQLDNSHLLGNCHKVYTDAKIMELLSLVFQKNESKQKEKYCKTISDRNKIHEAASILVLDIYNPPCVRDLALKVGLNEKKLKYGFKEVFNTTVYGYLFEHKMSLAQQLLLDTSKSISEVAILSGYEYLSHFCTAFKRKFGTSPKAIRSKGIV